MPTPTGFPVAPLNMFAVFKGLTDQNIGFFTGSGAPVNGTTGATSAAPGSVYINTANGAWYRNTGTIASPTWTVVA